MTPEQILSDFIDAWNAGRRPDVDEYLARAPDAEREALADDIATWLTWAPTPAYSEAALSEIRSEPVVQEVLAARDARTGLWPALLPRLRARASVSTGELAATLSSLLGLSHDRADRVEGYLDRMERGDLDPQGVSSRVTDALGRAFGVRADDLRGAGTFGAGGALGAGALYRAEAGAADDLLAEDLEVLARAMTAPSPEPWDEVDRLFLGARGER